MTDAQAVRAKRRLQALLRAVQELGLQAKTDDLLALADIYVKPH